MSAKQNSNFTGPTVVAIHPSPLPLTPCNRSIYFDPQPQSAYRPMAPRQPIQLNAAPAIRVGGVPVNPTLRSATPAPYAKSNEGTKVKGTSIPVASDAPSPQRKLAPSAPHVQVAAPTSPVATRRKGFEVRRSTDTPKLAAPGSPYLLGRKSGGISRTDLAAQRSAFAAHCLEIREANLKKLAAEAKMSADNARHSLLLLAYLSRQWRKETARSAPTAPSSTVTSSVPILDLYRDGLKYVGVLQDIDNVMGLPTVVATNDEKNMYQKVLQNLSELGLFRPYATPKADWESAAARAPTRGQRRIRLAADQ